MLPPLLRLEKIPVERSDVQVKINIFRYLQDKGIEVAPTDGEVDLLLGSNSALAMALLCIGGYQQSERRAIRDKNQIRLDYQWSGKHCKSYG